jgi:hypothetical protein
MILMSAQNVLSMQETVEQRAARMTQEAIDRLPNRNQFTQEQLAIAKELTVLEVEVTDQCEQVATTDPKIYDDCLKRKLNKKNDHYAYTMVQRAIEGMPDLNQFTPEQIRQATIFAVNRADLGPIGRPLPTDVAAYEKLFRESLVPQVIDLDTDITTQPGEQPGDRVQRS